jgi:predicted ATPase/Tfp pilus assembly protein PilF
MELLAAALGLSSKERSRFLAARSRPTAPAIAAQQAEAEAAQLWPEGLPMPATPLIAREEELASILKLLLHHDVRLLTLCGSPGVGKTRLALAAAAQVASACAGGVCWVPLALIDEPDLLAPAILRALEQAADGDTPLAKQVITALRTCQPLLLLDNFEQLMPAALVIAELLAACPELKILITSRSPLRLSGEHVFSVPPLALPALPRSYHRLWNWLGMGQRDYRDGLARSPAVALFVARARAARLDFTITADNASAIAAICARLDGLPLALELAAARLDMLSPASVLARLERPLDLLTDGPPDLPPRQQTLRAALAWSYSLLEPRDQPLFRCLGAFSGSASLDALVAVYGTCVDNTTSHEPRLLPPSTGIGGEDLFAPLTRLVRSGLVSRAEEPEEDALRVGLLDTVRDYAHEQLQAAGECEAMARSHACHFTALAEEAEPQMRGAAQALWLRRLDRDHANFLTALRWSLGQPELELALRLAGALGRYWWIRGYLHEGLRWLEQALAVSQVGASEGGPERGAARGVALGAQAKALHSSGLLAQRLGDYPRAITAYEAGLTRFRELGDTRGIAGALNNLGTIACDQGNLTLAQERYAECLILCRHLKDDWGVATALTNLGVVAHHRGDYARATAAYRESLDIRRQREDARGVAIALAHLADVACAQGTASPARTLCEESLAIRRNLADLGGIADSLDILATITRLEGDLAQAEALARESLALGRELADTDVIAFTLITLAHIQRDAHNRTAATLHFREALMLLLRLQNKPGIATCLEGLAGLFESAQGTSDALAAARFLGAATALRQATGIVLPPVERAHDEAARKRARALLGEECFSDAWREGLGAPLARIVAEANGGA